MSAPKKIMIIDDDADDRFFFREAVKTIGGFYPCCEARHGEDALEKLQEAESLPHFIFLDLNMPLMNGKECLRGLKRNEKLKNIPVIIYTTSISEEDKKETLNLGAAYYLTKPSDVFSLPGEISKAIKKAEEISSTSM